MGARLGDPLIVLRGAPLDNTQIIVACDFQIL
jgi:hypothetical protein